MEVEQIEFPVVVQQRVLYCIDQLPPYNKARRSRHPWQSYYKGVGGLRCRMSSLRLFGAAHWCGPCCMLPVRSREDGTVVVTYNRQDRTVAVPLIGTFSALRDDDTEGIMICDDTNIPSK